MPAALEHLLEHQAAVAEVVEEIGMRLHGATCPPRLLAVVALVGAGSSRWVVVVVEGSCPY